jgi:poly-gamma-glutamate synthesis protein (capsule biosynthesis protein)
VRRTASLLALGAVLLTGCGGAPSSEQVVDPSASLVTSVPAEPAAPSAVRAVGPASRSRHRSFTMLLTGDVLLHDGFWSTARRDGHGRMDFRRVLADMRPTVSSADLAICHLETPLAPARGPFASYPVFSAPPQIARALAWEGYDACTTASNHTVDQGFAGIRRTIADLDRAGLAHTGSYATKRRAGLPVLLRVRGATVALIAATFGLNGLPLPEGRPWSVNLIDPQRIIGQATGARAAGADVVVVALHWGDEYVAEPSDFQVEVARALARSGEVDLVYGHHAHVVQPYQRLGRTWVVYGLGNAIAQQDPAVPAMWEGNAARVTFRQEHGRWHVARLVSRPTYITPYGGRDSLRYLDVDRALHQRHWAYLHARLVAAREHVRRVVESYGVRPGRTSARASTRTPPH